MVQLTDIFLIQKKHTVMEIMSFNTSNLDNHKYEIKKLISNQEKANKNISIKINKNKILFSKMMII